MFTYQSKLLSIIFIHSINFVLSHESSKNGFSQSYASFMNSFQQYSTNYTAVEINLPSDAFKIFFINVMGKENLQDTNSSSCFQNLQLMNESRNEAWVQKFLDSFGRRPPGLTIGAVNWFGSYELCTTLHNVHNSPIQGQYCTAYIAVEKIEINIGLCLPKNCTHEDMMFIIKDMIYHTKRSVNVTMDLNKDSYCHKTHKLTIAACVMISLISFISLLIVLGTLFDYYLYCKPRVHFNISTLLPVNEQNVPLIQNQDFSGRVSPNQYLDISSDKQHYNRVDTHSGIVVKIFLSFSLKRNISKLFDTRTTKSTLHCIHGIRFYSMCWIILAHVYGLPAKFSNNSKEFASEQFQKHTFDIIVAGTFAVDSFFLISGILTAYLFHSTMNSFPQKLKSAKFWIMFYIHRLWRLTPPYMLFLGTYVALVPYLSEGPIWPQFQDTSDPICEANWWQNLLYINNLFGALNTTCMPHSWYLANDMQFYAISPISLIFMHKNWLVGLLINVSVIIFSMFSTFFTSFEGKYPLMFKATNPNIYIRPWVRIGPYMVGLTVGYYIHKYRCKQEMSRIVNVLVWLCAIGLTSVFIFSFHNDLTHDLVMSHFDEYALINATCRICWSLGLAWIIYTCCNKYGGLINRMLSWKALIPLSRLSYCAYLVHPIVMYVCLYSLNQPLILSGLAIAQLYCSFLVLSYCVAFVVTMFYEMPMMELERVLLKT